MLHLSPLKIGQAASSSAAFTLRCPTWCSLPDIIHFYWDVTLKFDRGDLNNRSSSGKFPGMISTMVMEPVTVLKVHINSAGIYIWGLSLLYLLNFMQTKIVQVWRLPGTKWLSNADCRCLKSVATLWPHTGRLFKHSSGLWRHIFQSYMITVAAARNFVSKIKQTGLRTSASVPLRTPFLQL